MPNRIVVNETLRGEPQTVARVGGGIMRGKSSTTDNISERIVLGTSGRQAYGVAAPFCVVVGPGAL